MSNLRRSNSEVSNASRLMSETAQKVWDDSQRQTQACDCDSLVTPSQRPILSKQNRSHLSRRMFRESGGLSANWLSRMIRRVTLMSAGVLIPLAAMSAAHAQPPQEPGYSIGFGDPIEGEMFSQPAPEFQPDIYTMSQPAGSQNAERAFGWNVKAGHAAGQSYGREESITYIQMMPYVFYEESMFFGDIRFARTNNGYFTGNGGGGYKYYSLEMERTFGAAIWYDRDDTAGSVFEQTTIGLESLGDLFDWRGNYYMPTGNRKQDISVALLPETIDFQGNNIIFDQIRTIGLSLEGFDTEVGIPLRYGWLGEHDTRMFGGAYLLKHDEIDDIVGWKGRIETWLTPNIDLNLQVANDKQFDTTVQFNASFYYDSNEGLKGSGKRSTWERMTLPMQRQATVGIARVDQLEADQLAINPRTGLAYEVRHVRSGVVGPGTGAVTDPFTTIENARVSPGDFDIIYVHGNSTFSGADASFAINENTYVFGEGAAIDRVDGNLAEIDHLIPEATFGQIIVPKVFTGAARPTLTNITGDAITMNNNSEFSGFVIGTQGVAGSGATGRGIVIDNVTTTENNFVDLFGITQEGVVIEDADGLINFNNLFVENPGGDAFVYLDNLPNGGQRPLITVELSEIIHDSGYSVRVENTERGILNMGTSTITETDGRGIQVKHDPGVAGSVVTLDNISITRTVGSADAGVEIDGGASLVTLRNSNGGSTTITGVGDGGVTNTGAIYIHDTEVGSQVQASDVFIDDRRSHGINMERIGGTVSFQSAVSMEDMISGADPGISFQESTGSVTFNSIAIQEGLGIGIEIGEVGTDNSTSARFTVEGTTVFDALGNNSNVGTGTNNASIFITDDNARVTFNGIVDNNRNDESIEVVSNRGAVFFNGLTQINNNFIGNTAVRFSNNSAINLVENTGNVQFSSLDINNQIGQSAINIDYQTIGTQYGGVNLGDVNVDANGVEAILARGVNYSLTTTSGIIDVVGETAIDIETTDVDETLTELNMTLTSVSAASSGAGDVGTRLVNLSGQFVITGDGTLGSGGLYTLNTTAFLVDNSALVTDAIVDGDDPQDVLDLFNVALNNVEFRSNNFGVFGDTIDTFNITNSEFITNGFESIVMTDVINFNLIGNEFSNNGGPNNGSILVEDTGRENTVNVLYTRVLEGGAFYNNIVQSNIFDDNDDVLFFATQAGIADSDPNNDIPDDDEPNIAILIDQNTIATETAGTVDGEVVLETRLEGSVLLDITNNTIDRDGTGTNILDINSLSDTEGLILNIVNNQVRGFDNAGVSALAITTSGDSLINITDNLFEMTGGSNAVLNFTLQGPSVTVIDSNIISETTDSGVGILFNRVEAPFSLTLDNNLMTLTDANNLGFQEAGVLFQQVIGTATLNSNANNIVNFINPDGFERVFQMPVNTNNGTVTINGLQFP